MTQAFGPSQSVHKPPDDMIIFENVSFEYDGTVSSYKCLTSMSFTVKRGECIVLCGPSGCGKTTITRLINGLIPHHFDGELEGRVIVGGKHIAEQSLAHTSLTVGSVFQNPRSQFFNVDTTDELAFGCENQALPVEEIKLRITETKELFELENLMDRSIFELSGGEKQRIACASVYATHPEVIVFDEPSSNLDAASIKLLENVIERLKAAGKTIVISEHRLYYLSKLADRFFYLKEGRLEHIYSSEQMRAFSRKELMDMHLRELSLENISQSAYRHPNNSAAINGRRQNNVNQALLSFKEIVCKHKQRPVLAIDNLTVNDHDIIAVIGHNGAGKSTFANCLCGLQKHEGLIHFMGEAINRKQRVAKSYMIMQDINHQLFTESVFEELTLNAADASAEKVDELLEQLSLSEYKETHPLALSGGQKQRVAIASALCSGKEFLIYDEPTSGLDYHSMKTACQLIEKAAQQATLSLIVTHDLEFIVSCCTSILHICEGKIKDHYPLDKAGIEKVRDHFLS